MKPLALEVRAFRGFRAPITLSLAGQGIVLVEGSNHDAPGAFESNGSGKSLLVVEAPMWALFDRTVRYGERAVTGEVTHPERGADVSFTFTQGGSTYCATRSRSPKGSPKFVLTQDGKPYPLSKDPATARREMAEVLGFDYIAFRHAVVVQGGDSLASAGFAAQMGVLEMILRTYTLAKAADRASQAAIAAERDVASVEGMLRATSEAFERATRAIQTAEQVLRDQPDPSTLIAQMKASDEVGAQVEPLRVEIETLAVQMAQVRERMTAADHRVVEVRMEVKQAGEGALQAVTAAKQAITSLACPVCKRPYAKTQDPLALREDLGKAEAALAQVIAAGRVAIQAAESVAALALQESRALEPLSMELQARCGEAIKAQQRAEVYRAQLDGIERARRVAEDALERASREEEQAAQAAQAAIAEVEVARARAGQFRFWAKGFSRTDLQADLVASATPVLNEAAARHAHTLTGGQIFVTFDPFRASNREDLVRIAGASAPTYAGLSRGEKERVDLIIALSLRDLARWRLPEPVQFSVYDECFDAMDTVGLRTVANLLQVEAARGGTIVVVTHSKEFRALFPQAKIVRVIKRNGEAEVEFSG